jgi:hypothetical protein
MNEYRFSSHLPLGSSNLPGMKDEYFIRPLISHAISQMPIEDLIKLFNVDKTVADNEDVFTLKIEI